MSYAGETKFKMVLMYTAHPAIATQVISSTRMLSIC